MVIYLGNTFQLCTFFSKTLLFAIHQKKACVKFLYIDNGTQRNDVNK
nr:MAG TPA: hypothetical protein [Caudoviricetes sp.]